MKNLTKLSYRRKIQNILQQFNIKQTLNTVKSFVQVAFVNSVLRTTQRFYVVIQVALKPNSITLAG